MKVKFKRLHKDAVIPSKKIEDDICFDLTAVTEEEIATNVWSLTLFNDDKFSF